MIGVRLGSWIIEAEIGRGGMGAVYKASRAPDADPGPELAAVKVLAAELAVEVGFQHRFQREIDILTKLEHPNIVRLIESGVRSNRYYYVMEYIDGSSFEALRDDQGRIPWSEVLGLACQIAPALKHAHDRGIIHRDLKPANILRTSPSAPSPGVVKLTDFGIASLFASPHLTVTGGVIGTPEYLSPEQAAGKPVTPRSDLYSLGVVLYTLVTGNTPYTGEPVDLLHKHRFGQFDRPIRVIPDLPPDIDDLICNLLEKDPGKRPADAAVLARRLESIRKKLLRQARLKEENTHVPADRRGEAAREGTATMVSRVVREELHGIDRGGPLQRFFNKPIVLATLFLLCVSTLVWTFWPLSAETLYQRGAALMASGDPYDWETAWEKYLTPLEQKYPDHRHQEELEAFRQRTAEAREARKGRRAIAARASEGRWFFQKAMRARQLGDEAEAKRLLNALITAFRDVPEEQTWVKRAEGELARVPGGPDGGRLSSLREALKRARELAGQEKQKEARGIRKALAELYRGDAQAEKLLAE